MGGGQCDKEYSWYLDPLDSTKYVTVGCLALSLVLMIPNIIHMLVRKKILTWYFLMFLLLCFLQMTYLSLSLLCQMTEEQLGCVISKTSTLADILYKSTMDLSDNSTESSSESSTESSTFNNSISFITLTKTYPKTFDSTLFEFFGTSIKNQTFDSTLFNLFGTSIKNQTSDDNSDVTLEKFIDLFNLTYDTPTTSIQFQQLLETQISDITLKDLLNSYLKYPIREELLNSIFNTFDLSAVTRLVTLLRVPVSKAMLGLISWSVALLTIDRFIFSIEANAWQKGLFISFTSVLVASIPASLVVVFVKIMDWIHHVFNEESIEYFKNTFLSNQWYFFLFETGVYILLPLFIILIFGMTSRTKTSGKPADQRIATSINDGLIVTTVLMLFFFLLQISTGDGIVTEKEKVKEIGTILLTISASLPPVIYCFVAILGPVAEAKIAVDGKDVDGDAESPKDEEV